MEVRPLTPNDAEQERRNMDLYLATNAIGGAGHMAILKQLLAIDGRLESVAVESYF